MTLDEFLDAIDAGNKISERWSMWPYYTINNQAFLDHVVRFESLEQDLRKVAAEIGLPTDFNLPMTKTGIRPANIALSKAQIDRVATLFSREIALFGYEPP
jgi:hypothetical protein